MFDSFRPRLTYANVVSTLGLFILLGGGAYAASSLPKNSVSTKQIKNGAVTGRKLHKGAVSGSKVVNNSLTGQEINASTLAKVPSARQADSATTANSLAAPENWHEVGAPGEPNFVNGWNDTTAVEGGSSEHVAFYKDREGVVHLKGSAAGGASSTVIFQLPPGYRPATFKTLAFAAVCRCSESRQDSAGESVTIPLPTGQVEINGTSVSGQFDGGVILETSGDLVDVDGITFRAAS